MSVLIYEKKGRIAYLTLNRPESRNALSYELMGELEKAWIDFRDDDNLWVAILTGAGKAFCAGLDLKERAAQGSFFRPEGEGRGLMPLSLGIWKPIICAVNGPAYAAGWLLTQECDIRIAAETARFAITEVKMGMPAIGLESLPRYMPLGLALEILLTGDAISAQRACELGSVNRVVPPEELMPTATALAEHICENAPLALKITKELVYKSFYPAMHDRPEAWEIMGPAMSSEDILEGARAFIERRRPVWKGR